MSSAAMPTETTPKRSAEAARQVRRDTPLRQARTCYGHLAGVAGTRLMSELLDRGWIAVSGRDDDRQLYDLTPLGSAELVARDVNLAAARAAKGRFAYGCLDWTERRPHLAGALGVEVMRALQRAGIGERTAGIRVVTLRRPLENWFSR